jgi:hypothetical protein
MSAFAGLQYGTEAELLTRARLSAAKTRYQVEPTPAFIGIHRVIAQDRPQRGLGSATVGPRGAWILCANARGQTGDTRIACHMPSTSRGGQPQATRA